MKIDINIDRDIPVPVIRNGRPPKYPFADLRPGDTFLIPFSEKEARPKSPSAPNTAPVIVAMHQYNVRRTPNKPALSYAVDERGVVIYCPK